MAARHVEERGRPLSEDQQAPTKLLIAEALEAERACADTHTFNRLFGRDEEGERRLTVEL